MQKVDMVEESRGRWPAWSQGGMGGGMVGVMGSLWAWLWPVSIVEFGAYDVVG